MLTFEVTFASKQMFFPLVKCFDFEIKERSMFDPLSYDTAYLNAVIFGAQAYMDMFLGRSRKGSLRQLLKTIQLLRDRLCITDGYTPISDTTILIVLTLAHIAHLRGEHITAEQHLQGLYKIITLRGGIAAFQDTPKLLTELLRLVEILAFVHLFRIIILGINGLSCSDVTSA